MFGHKSFLRLGSFENRSIGDLYQDCYELASFTHHFQQDIDQNGKVLSSVKGGTITLLIEGFPSQTLVDWGIESRLYYSGEIVVVDAENIPCEKIKFSDGACTFFKIHYINTGRAYCVTKLIIEANEVSVDGEMELKKHWTTN